MSFDQIACEELEEREVNLLARMLAVLCRADGNIHPLEIALFSSFVRLNLGDDPAGSIRSFTEPTAEEIATVGRPHSEMIYLYCALLVCGDKAMDETERALLTSYGQTLGLGADRAAALEKMARTYVLDQAAQLMWKIPGQPYDKAMYLTVIARRLGASDEEIDAAWAGQDATE